MKVTKYPQSCLLLEKEGSRIIIDPGAFVSGDFSIQDLGKVDGILLTHEHPDHVDPELITKLVDSQDIPVVGNQSTKDTFGDHLVTHMIVDREEMMVGKFRVTAHELPHCDMPDGSPGPQNTGYIIDGVLFHPGDGTKITGVSVPNVAAPIAGTDVSPRDAFDLCRSVGAKVLIPIHYDYFKEDPSTLAEMAAMLNMPFEIHSLKNGESLDL